MDWELEDVVVTWKIWSEKHVTKRRGCFGGLGPEMCMFCFVCWFLLFVECQMFWICMYREFMYI